MEKLYLRVVPALLVCQKDIIEDVEDKNNKDKNNSFSG